MIHEFRLSGQQLVNPRFDNPKDLVSWMGAIQAQDYGMWKWAVGIRLKNGTASKVEEAWEQGEILRTHVLRPTWHVVTAEDIRWMLELSRDRQIGVYNSYYKQYATPEPLLFKCLAALEKILEGKKSLTREEIETELMNAGFSLKERDADFIISRAEIEGIVCSGLDGGKKPTFSLLEERAAPVEKITRQEALAKLATAYFQSHSPASMTDFIWWSGLSATEARQAIASISDELIADRYEGRKVFLHKSCCKGESENVLHFLPSYDEYIISYKDRTDVLALEHQAKAHNNFGIFYPVILYNGKIVGNWKKTTKKSGVTFEITFFPKNGKIPKKLIKEAEERYRAFIL